MQSKKSYSEELPRILEKTYSSCKNVSQKCFPAVRVSSRIFGEKIISLPFIDTISEIEISNKILENKDFKNSKIEIRVSGSNGELVKKLEKMNFKKNIVKGHLVSNLINEKDFWNKLSKQTKKGIKRAINSGLIVKNIDSKEELKKSYKLYFDQMKRFGSPQHSLNFFLNCFEELRGAFMGFNCYLNDRLIGSIINFVEKETLYVAFSISERKFKKLRANDLLYWESIKEGRKRNLKKLDMGQIDINPKKDTREEALLNFKKKWLGVAYEKIYFTKGFEYEENKKNNLKRFRKIWRMLPRPIIKMIGPKICSQLG